MIIFRIYTYGLTVSCVFCGYSFANGLYVSSIINKRHLILTRLSCGRYLCYKQLCYWTLMCVSFRSLHTTVACVFLTFHCKIDSFVKGYWTSCRKPKLSKQHLLLLFFAIVEECFRVCRMLSASRSCVRRACSKHMLPAFLTWNPHVVKSVYQLNVHDRLSFVFKLSFQVRFILTCGVLA